LAKVTESKFWTRYRWQSNNIGSWPNIGEKIFWKYRYRLQKM